MIYDWVLQWISRRQFDTAPAMLVEQQRAHCKSVLVVDGEVVVLLGSAVEFRVPDLHIGLAWSKAHWIAAWLSWCILPELRVAEAVV